MVFCNIQKTVLLAIKYEHLFLSSQIYAKISMKNVLYWKLQVNIFLSGFHFKRVW